MLPSSLMKDFDVLQKFLIDMHQSSVFIYIYIITGHIPVTPMYIAYI